MTITAIEEADRVTSTDEDDVEDVRLGKEEQKHQFVVLRAKGYSYARITKELGVSKGTLTAWNAELDVEVAKLRAVELEALQEEFFLLKEGRIRLIGEQLKAIQTEIGKRDLSKVNTDKLLELQLRYFGELKGEYVETGRRTRTGPKLNSSDIREELQTVLVRYRAGEIGEAQAKLEEAILQSMLKAIDQTELAAKVERLEAVIGSRRQQNDKDGDGNSSQENPHQGVDRVAGWQAHPPGYDRRLSP